MYNGYSNHDTWNAVLWLSNDPAPYNAARRLISGDQLAEIAVFYIPEDEIDWDEVDWDEVLSSLLED